MRRLCLALAFTLAGAASLVLHDGATPVHAQAITPNQNITVVDSGTACVTAPAACAIYMLDSVTPAVTFSISGTWTGTLTFEGTNNDATWTSVLVANLATAASATTTTANGTFGLTNSGFLKLRVRATAAITGSALVTLARGSGVVTGPGGSVAATGQFLAADGTVAAPGYAYTAEPGLGWYRTGANTITLATGGANYFTSDGAKFKMAAGLPLGWTATNSAAALDTAFSRTAAGVIAFGTGAQGSTAGQFAVGTGTAAATFGGTLFTSTTATATTGTIEETLLQYTLPANTLAVNGRGLRITVYGTTAANANSKTLKLYFGLTVLNSLNTTSSGSGLVITGTVFRTGASTQISGTTGLTNTGLAIIGGTASAEALSGTVLIKVTGTTPTLLGDITAQILLVEAI